MPTREKRVGYWHSPGMDTMARKAFLLRIDDEVLAEVQRWADEDLRSLNGQIEFLLRQSLQKRGVKKKERDDSQKPLEPPDDER